MYTFSFVSADPHVVDAAAIIAGVLVAGVGFAAAPCDTPPPVYGCQQCGCAVLKYTEYGGYYIDQRVRLVDAALITDAT